MTRDDLLTSLLATQEALGLALPRVLDAQARHQHARMALTQETNRLLTSEALTGRNAEMRQAQLVEYTWDLQVAQQDAERTLREAMAQYDLLHEELLTLRAAVPLVAAAGG